MVRAAAGQAGVEPRGRAREASADRQGSRRIGTGSDCVFFFLASEQISVRRGRET